MYIATIDTGTTNTRVTIWSESAPAAIAKMEVGVRDTSIDGNNQRLLRGIRECLIFAMQRAGVEEKDLECILASGMIGSELGIMEIPRAFAPASAEEIAKHCVKELVTEISAQIPIMFIPGIQNLKEITREEDLQKMDFMRGEEVEAFAIAMRENITGSSVLVMPGSHTKFVFLDENSRIVGCVTSMAGEILMNFVEQSIIKKSLPDGYATSIDPKWLLRGAKEARDVGLNKAVFSVRIRKLYSDASSNELANFLLGAVIYEDIKVLFQNRVYTPLPDDHFYICGTNTFSQGFRYLLEREAVEGAVRAVSDENMENLAGAGALLIWEKWKKRL